MCSLPKEAIAGAHTAVFRQPAGYVMRTFFGCRSPAENRAETRTLHGAYRNFMKTVFHFYFISLTLFMSK